MNEHSQPASVDGSSQKPVAVAKGCTGSVEVLADKVRITHNRLLTKLHGFAGESKVEIALSDLRLLRFHAARGFGLGYIHFGYTSQPESLNPPGWAFFDINAVSFTRGQQDDFEKIPNEVIRLVEMSGKRAISLGPIVGTVKVCFVPTGTLDEQLEVRSLGVRRYEVIRRRGKILFGANLVFVTGILTYFIMNQPAPLRIIITNRVWPLLPIFAMVPLAAHEPSHGGTVSGRCVLRIDTSCEGA
jgi:hypothetical protein